MPGDPDRSSLPGKRRVRIAPGPLLQGGRIGPLDDHGVDVHGGGIDPPDPVSGLQVVRERVGQLPGGLHVG